MAISLEEPILPASSAVLLISKTKRMTSWPLSFAWAVLHLHYVSTHFSVPTYSCPNYSHRYHRRYSPSWNHRLTLPPATHVSSSALSSALEFWALYHKYSQENRTWQLEHHRPNHIASLLVTRPNVLTLSSTESSSMSPSISSMKTSESLSFTVLFMRSQRKLVTDW